ncbi:hypothetical protein BFS15_04455 [Gardnerella sp. DNF01162]|nr:hypothetical protein BFS15_04455 [Gardnerella sp. DNF01162]
MLSTQARSAFVSKDEGRAGSCGCVLGTRLCFVCANDLPERSIARAKAIRSGNSLGLEVQWTSNASFVSECCGCARLERRTTLIPPNVRNFPRVWSAKVAQTLQT